MVKWLIKLSFLKKLLLLVVTILNWTIKGGLERISSGIALIRRTWQGVSKFKRHLFINCIVGIAIAVFLHFVHNTRFVSETENLAMDGMMYVNQNTPRMMGEKPIEERLKFTFIDIDENTYRTWDEPAQVPRDKLLKLIQYASRDGGAKAIVVDIDFSNPSNNVDDKALLAFLEKYNESYPPLFIIRDFYPRSKFTQGKTDQIRPSIIDQIDLGKHVFQAHPVFKQSDYDQVVRYWELLQMGCINNVPIVLPAFQLLVDAYLNSSDTLTSVVQQLKQKKPSDCKGMRSNSNSLSGELLYAKKNIVLDSDESQRLGERIIFTLPWLGKSLTSNELLIKPAYRLTEVENEKLSTSAVDGRVVVIGASFQNSRDNYQTPLGEMPGGVIIINAIKSLHLYGQIKPPSTIQKLMIELVLILFMAWAFARFSSFYGAVATIILIVIVLLPMSFYFFKYGLWVDLAIPILGMQLHQLVAEFEENHAVRQSQKKHSQKN